MGVEDRIFSDPEEETAARESLALFHRFLRSFRVGSRRSIPFSAARAMDSMSDYRTSAFGRRSFMAAFCIRVSPVYID